MDLEFEVKGKQILRTNIQVLASKNSKCHFIFKNKEWWGLDKYIIFWTNEGKSIIKYLGKGDKCKCRLPEKIMKDNLFSIQIYANDTYKTQKLKVGAIPEEYTISNPHLKNCKEKKTFQKEDPEVLLYKVFSLMENKIDDIKYNNGFLECYSNKQLICKTPIFRNIRQEIRENIKDLMPYFEVKKNGNIYAVYPYEK